jgi:hypothetical protein
MESKNIHVLQTDKPSRLLRKEKELLLVEIPKVYTFFGNTVSVNIYITNDDNIKKGDSVYCNYSNTVHKDYQMSKSCCKKIILTTDLDLIKDGVQSIDNEFLEWFVKNPSCDEVDVFKVFQVNQNNPVLRHQERSYNEKELKQAWEDGRNGTALVGIPPFTITKFKHSSFVKWFDEFKNK